MNLDITDLFTNKLNLGTIIIAIILMIVANTLNVVINKFIENKIQREKF